MSNDNLHNAAWLSDAEQAWLDAAGKRVNSLAVPESDLRDDLDEALHLLGKAQIAVENALAVSKLSGDAHRRSYAREQQLKKENNALRALPGVSVVGGFIIEEGDEVWKQSTITRDCRRIDGWAVEHFEDNPDRDWHAFTPMPAGTDAGEFKTAAIAMAWVDRHHPLGGAE